MAQDSTRLEFLNHKIKNNQPDPPHEHLCRPGRTRLK
jgi:hypothetical protein